MTDVSQMSDAELLAHYAMPSLVKQESGGRAGVLGPQTKYGRAEGMTQMLPATAQATAKRIGMPWRPELMRGDTPEAADYQQTLGRAYLQEGIENTGNLQDGLRYYHGGPDRNLWGPKTNAYAEQVSGRLTAPSAPQADLSSMSDAELMALYRGGAPAAPAKPPQRASAAQAKPAPLVPQKAGPRVDQGLGFAKGLGHAGDRGAAGLEYLASKVGLDKPINALGASLGLPTRQDAEASRAEFLSSQEANGVRPGKIGEFAGSVAGTAWVPGGPLVQGAIGGMLAGDATDARGLAGEAALGGITARLAAGASDALQLGARKVLSKTPEVLDLPALKAAKTALYQQAEKSGFKFASNQVKQLADDFTAQVRAKGGPKAAQLIPAADAFSARLQALASQKGGVSLPQLDALRSDIYENLIAKGGAEAQQGYALRKAIDGLMDSSNAPFIKAARLANMKFEKVSEVTDRIKSASLAAGRANSGENVVNAIRQKLSPMIDPLHTGQVKNLTPDEAGLIERIVAGDTISNGLRGASKTLRNKFVSGPLAVMTGAGAGPWSGLALMGGLEAAGQGLRKGAENYTKGQINDLLRLMAVGGSKQALAPVATKASQATETAIAKLLRPALVSSAVPALAAARERPKPKQKK